MHAKSNDKRRRRLILGGSMALLAAVIVLLAFVVRSCTMDGRFEKYYNEGAAAYDAGDFAAAAEALEKALECGDSVDCYVLLANTYYSGLGDIDKAIEVLYVGSYKLDSDTIDDYLERLKQLQAESTAGADDDLVTIGGETVAKDVTSIILSQQRLQDDDLAPVAQLTALESLSLTDNGLTDISPLAGLTSLTFLQLGNNQVSDISALAGLTQLRTLYLDGNPISDFSPLYGLSNLRMLSIKNTGITDEQLEALQAALPNCSIHGEKGTTDEVVEITIGDVTFSSDVTELDLSGQGLTDISELEKCVNLQKLDLRDNDISDLTPLMDLTELEWLCLWNNEVEDIYPLMGLNLTYLDLDGNNVKDITAVSAMGSMKELWLSYNAIDSVEPLKKLGALERLGLKGTGLSDSDLRTLRNLTTLTELAIEDNDALSAGAVESLKAALPGCTVTHSELYHTVELGGTEYRSDAASITASGGTVTSIAGLEHFDALKQLTLINTAVTDLSPLSGLTALETLEIWSSDPGVPGELSDISALSGLTGLRHVNLMWNGITDISALESATGITELYLTGNSVADISALSGMTGLRELTLDRCPVSDLGPLSGLSSLKSLSLQGCGISDISALSGLTGLTELYIGSNSISDLTPLYSLTGLTHLSIADNDVTPEQVRALQEALPGCDIDTDLDLTVPEETPEPEETLELSGAAAEDGE